MIGKIKGSLEEVDGNIGLIETASGIFYRVYLTDSILHTAVPPCDIAVYTYHHIREDVQLLFGFSDKKEYKLFELLISVNGVGAKSAFTIISLSTVGELIAAVRSGDHTYFTRIKGLGKKTALKILLELSAKFDSEFVYEPEQSLSKADQTVIDALKSLGFAAQESSEVLRDIPSDLSTEEKIKQAINLITNQ